MSTDAIWQAFAETGDPLYYLLYKNVRERERQRPKRETSKDGAQGQPPRAED